MADVLSPQEGEKILDMCAAPGGKTTHIAELMHGTGEVVAWDIYEHKTRLIENAAKRLSLENIKACVQDSRTACEKLFCSFDRVLLDAPCSGLGIIRRKPDIKQNRKKEDIAQIVREQETLLDMAANYVKPGGVLVYSTCTINRTENEDMADGFLENHAEFLKDGEYINLYPHTDKTDGFFICRFKRRIW